MTANALSEDPEGAAPWPSILDQYLARYAPATRSGYSRDLADWTEWCADLDVPPLDAQRTHVDLWVRHLAENLGRGQSTIHRKLAAVAGAYRCAVAETLIEASPVDHARRPHLDDQSSTVGLTREQVAKLRAVAKADGPRSRALIDVLVFNGLQISEALSIRIEDVQDEGGHKVATIARRGGRTRPAPLAPVVFESFQQCAAGRTEGPLFGDLDRHNAYTLVVRLARRAGFRVTPQGLRCTWVVLSREAGVPLEDVQDAAGHADPRTTRRYDRVRRSLESHPTYALATVLDEVTPTS